MIRVLICDDQDMVCEGLRVILGSNRLRRFGVAVVQIREVLQELRPGVRNIERKALTEALLETSLQRVVRRGAIVVRGHHILELR